MMSLLKNQPLLQFKKPSLLGNLPYSSAKENRQARISTMKSYIVMRRWSIQTEDSASTRTLIKWWSWVVSYALKSSTLLELWLHREVSKCWKRLCQTKFSKMLFAEQYLWRKKICNRNMSLVLQSVCVLLVTDSSWLSHHKPIVTWLLRDRKTLSANFLPLVMVSLVICSSLIIRKIKKSLSRT